MLKMCACVQQHIASRAISENNSVSWRTFCRVHAALSMVAMDLVYFNLVSDHICAFYFQHSQSTVAYIII